MKKYIFLLACVIFTSIQIRAQPSVQSTNRVEIPFEYRNGFIIVNVLFNGIFSMKFILDTGAEYTILTKREITDLLQVNYDRKLRVTGADLSAELYAYLATDVELQVNDLVGLNRSILVLEHDYLQFEVFTGLEVQGILGSDFFRHYIMKIDYQKRVITLYDPQHFKPPKEGYQILPIEVDRNKPYIKANITTSQDTTIQNLKFLLDTGASLASLLETDSHPGLNLPEHAIPSALGIGLSGQLTGYLGRLPAIKMGDFQFREVVAHFQDFSETADTTLQSNRNGIIGNEILSRFTLIFDYYRGKLYLAPNKYYDDQFKYDRSGLQIIASGSTLNTFIIYNVIPGSPAAEAGIQAGDEIRRLNGQWAPLTNLQAITSILQKQQGKKINIKIKRGDQKIRFTFQLRDLI